MGYKYEIIRPEGKLPIKAIIHSVDTFEIHWHNEIELLLVLEGSINVQIGEEKYDIRENDLILINSNELHSTKRIKESNIILALQINDEYFNYYYPQFSNMKFHCKSFLNGEDEQERFDIIRYYVANIMWELNKKSKGYKFKIGSYLNLIGSHLVNNFEYTIVEDDNEALGDEDLIRLQRIIDYVNENIHRNITLKEVASKEHLNYYYLSHFIKDKMGMSFQDYVNNVRLNKAVDILINTDKTITELSYDSGFPNVASFNRLFKEIYNCTPTEYRRQYLNISNNDIKTTCFKKKKRSKSYLDVDRNTAFKKLFNYLEYNKKDVVEDNTYNRDIEYIYLNSKIEGYKFKPYWKKLTTFSRASEGLRSKWQNQLREVQKEIGFEYIRFHGIFSDDMMIVNYDEEGNIIYNWSYVDELFDFFMEVNIKPFIEFSFMPSEFKKSDETMFWWKANISQPKDIKLWTDLVVEFLKHSINRYGLEEVKTWYFEVWNEPDLEYVFWIGGKEEYFKFYKETALAVKSVSEELKVGGPAITHQTVYDEPWLEDFLLYCHNNNIPLDFVSLHIYPEAYSSKDEEKELLLQIKEGKDIESLMEQWRQMKKIYFDKNHTKDALSSANEIIENNENTEIELHITEWNASSNNRNLIHDTCFVATYIIDNVLKSIGKADSLGYWTFTDLMEETKLGISEFHGNFGLITKGGLKKPSYFAYYILGKLGEEIIGQGEEYIVTKSNEDIQILAYNYTYFDNLFLNGDTSLLTNEERYLIYEEKLPKEININIKGIAGEYKITRYKLNRNNGSVFDEWLKMGAPENMTKEEIEYLSGKAKPKMTIEYMKIKDGYEGRMDIPVHGVELIVLEKII